MVTCCLLQATRDNVIQESACKSERISELEQDIAELKSTLLYHQQRIRENESHRRKLHNTIQELKGLTAPTCPCTACIHLCTCSFMYIYVHVLLCTFICTCTCSFMYIYMYVHKHNVCFDALSFWNATMCTYNVHVLLKFEVCFSVLTWCIYVGREYIFVHPKN